MPKLHLYLTLSNIIYINQQITAIKALLGREGEQFLLFGMLTQLQEGKVHLEDANGSIELDLSACVSLQSHFW